jgi:AcrR family transcriptional regulator
VSEAAQRGRPRSAEADRAILEAALHVLERDGFARMSMDSVAEEAGVGKTTIYRRYRDKADLLTGALAALRDDDEVPDSGDTRADLLELLERFVASKERLQSMRLLGSLFTEKERTPELLDLFRERVIGPRRDMMLAVLERGRERGELRADMDAALITEMMIGAWFALQLNGRPFEGDWPSAVLAEAWPSLSACPPGP